MQLGLFNPRWNLPKEWTPEPWRDPFLEEHAERLHLAGDGRLRFDENIWDWSERAEVVVDVELYRNFLVICFQRLDTNHKLAFEKSDRCELDRDSVARVMRSNTIFSFNGDTYDLLIMRMAMRGASLHELKALSDQIIARNDARGWQIAQEHGLRASRDLDHVDLFEPNPSVGGSLKTLHARLHGRLIVDLPYPPDSLLTHEQMNIATLYCFNDLDATRMLREAMREPIALRESLGARYHVDLRSKSDAQVGETIVKLCVERSTGKRVIPVDSPRAFTYDAPKFLHFEGRELRKVLIDLDNALFHVGDNEKIVPPPALDDLKIKVGETVYSMGLGGLHSTEAHRAIVANDERTLIDVDASSQYPKIILKLGLVPPSLGPTFLDVYGSLVAERLAAKARGDAAMRDGLKIAVNGIFGKLGSRYGCLSARKLMIAVTLTGQLSILMLIERAEMIGIPVVSANTDGVLFHAPRARLDDLRALLRLWEQETGMETEEVEYRAIYASSVNSYLALKLDGKSKRKGPMADPWSENDLRNMMQKNPQMTVCSQAVLNLVRDGTPIDETIVGCRDPRMFVTVIKVAGGALWRGHPLGRVVRYYWSRDGEEIRYAGRNAKVMKSEGARPLLELTDHLPTDIDHLRYCEAAAKLATEMGYK